MLAESPEHFDAWNMLGIVLHLQGRYPAAVQCFDRAISIDPGIAAAHAHRGLPLQKLRQYEDALASYDRALALRADFPEALINRGNVLQDLDRPADAVASYDRALALRPGVAEALFNRGNALQALKRHADALASYDRALASKSDYPEALVNRGLALEDLNRLEEALASYDRALAQRPGYARALHNRGAALMAAKRWNDAANSFARLIEQAPDYDYAAGNLQICRLQSCDWDGLPQLVGHVERAVAAGAKAASPFSFLAISGRAEAQRRCAQTWIADKHPASPAPMWTGERYRNDRIRVAYLSADFRDHPVAFLMARLFEIHDRQRFDPIAISFRRPAGDAMGRRIGAAFEQVLDVSAMSDREVAERIRDLRVDIAVDLMGFTTGSRTAIFAHRAAPIQVGYLGFPGTMGANYIDYLIADEFVIPKRSEGHYSERIVRLPDTFQVNDDARRVERKSDHARGSGPSGRCAGLLLAQQELQDQSRDLRPVDARAAERRRQCAVALRGQCVGGEQPSPRGGQAGRLA